MAGLVEIAAPLKFLCCAREQMLHEQKLRLHKSGLSARQTSVQHAANVSFQPIYTFTLFYVSKHTLP
jgi:hypothetical protein